MNKELEFKRRELRVNFYGDKVAMNYPTSMDLKAYQEKLLADGADYLGVSFDFLEGLGAKKETLERCEMPDLEELISIICGQKKI